MLLDYFLPVLQNREWFPTAIKVAKSMPNTHKMDNCIQEAGRARSTWEQQVMLWA